jgi:proteasome lid subunit RPN8/RPN11
MILNIKITSPKGFRFPSGLSDIDAMVLKPTELRKHKAGTIENGVMTKIGITFQYESLQGTRLLLVPPDRAKLSKILLGQSAWIDVYLVPSNVVPDKGMLDETDLLLLGTGMVVTASKDGSIPGEVYMEKVYYALIKKHVESSYPNECGGLVLGMVIDGDLHIKKIIPLENVSLESKQNRIEINPLDYVKAERLALKESLGIWGFYHSHPNSPAVPSDFDREHLPFTNWWYPIISVKDGAMQEIRCWQLLESRESFSEIRLEIPDLTPTVILPK